MSVLFPAQQKALAPVIAGQLVYDLGCGNMQHATTLLQLGAARVIGIDKVRFREPLGVEFRQCYFQECDPINEIAFISWPNNNASVANALVKLTLSARVVVYLGSNMNGNACAEPVFFRSMISRKLLNCVPHRINTLLIYGELQSPPRIPEREEYAGLTMYDGSEPLNYQES